MKKTKTLQNSNDTTAIPRAQVIKLGLDVHADSIVVVRIEDGQAPQPAQRFAPEKFLAWAQKQLALAGKVYACYEAGPLGYSLQRTLTALGIICYVVRPRDCRRGQTIVFSLTASAASWRKGACRADCELNIRERSIM